jgi:competence protein ComEA
MTNSAQSGVASTLARGMPGIGLAVLLLVPPVGAQQVLGTNQWETLEGCRLLTNAVVDGDSFRVLHKEREYLFRLYFVDAAETDSSLKDRVQDQAAYFGISVQDIPRVGKLGAEFTREKLSGRDFTVLTRWQNAMGRSSLARFYCVVLVEEKNLAEELVAGGLARIYGLRANWPDGPRSTTFINRLKNFELEAREQKRGVWDETRFARISALDVNGTNSAPTAVAEIALAVDVNRAGFEELQRLPGIGRVLAERIIANRPYKKVDDLEKVSGIGPKTLERLRPLVHVETAEP